MRAEASGGDIAAVDDDGFITLTDRLSRFSKIGGEMVPHLKVEEIVGRLLGDAPCVVTAVTDPERGERLVLFYTAPAVSPQELWEQLGETELPKLWIPKRPDIRRIDELPLLGTGKVDLRRIRALAEAGTPAPGRAVTLETS
jgi:acyl-[acyl-carrier-protein]-phospholipid O-acyltransferase / long-chain-fatty-acid--[acyl-carrier-protein] ligase